MKLAPVLLALSIAGLALGSCAPEYKQFSRWSRKGSIAEKDSAAFYFFERKDYERAAFLFEELRAAYRGSQRDKVILYHIAYSKYNQRLYSTAAYHFEQYANLYPNDERTPECTFMVGYCYYLESAPYYLDQSLTRKAMAQLQLFVNNYPFSDRVERCNELLNELRERLARKKFEQASLYLKIENYRAAVSAFQGFMQEFPDSRYREEAQFLLIRAAVLLAEVSIADKKRNRYLDAIEFYEQFVDRYPSSVYLRDAETLFARAKRGLGRLDAQEAEAGS